MPDNPSAGQSRRSSIPELAAAIHRADGGSAHIHLVGIGGRGMSAIARLLIEHGIEVSGSDVKESAATASLRELGATIFLRHRAGNIDGALALITSGAIGASNPEVAEAGKRGIAVLQRAAALNALMQGKTGIAIAGTAGKSSTSAMLTVAMQRCGADASYAIGAIMRDTGTNAALSRGSMFIAEADESDSSFLLLSPDVALITNVESDHLDFHGTIEKYRQAFEDFTDRIPDGGLLVTSADDKGARALARHAGDRIRVRTFGEATDADLRISDIRISHQGTTYQAAINGSVDLEIKIKQPGQHMAKNSAGALLAAHELGLPVKNVAEALNAYNGVCRRFDLVGTERGVYVYDDFAHSPAKVREQLRAAKTLAEGGKLWVIFEAPRVKGEQRLAADFASALGQAEVVLLVDEEAAQANTLDDADPGKYFWLTAVIAKELKSSRQRVRLCEGEVDVLAAVRAGAQPGDVAVTMGMRDMSGLCADILRELRS